MAEVGLVCDWQVAVRGSGVERDSVMLNEPASFVVDARYAGIADVAVTVIDSECQPMDVSVRQREADDVDHPRDSAYMQAQKDSQSKVYECSYVPSTVGKHTVSVTYGSVNVAQSPYKVCEPHI